MALAALKSGLNPPPCPRIYPLMPATLESALPPQLESEVSFQLLFHQHPLPMWVVDATSLAFIVVNDAAVKKYGYSRPEFLAMTMDQMAEPEDRAEEAGDP